MPILSNFDLPASPASLPLAKDSNDAFFLVFIASDDPATGESWCPDVRASLPHLKRVFGANDGPTLALVEVGQKPEWRDPSNVFRTKWDVKGVPTLVRYQIVNGQIADTGRINEDGILDQKTFADFVRPTSQA